MGLIRESWMRRLGGKAPAQDTKDVSAVRTLDPTASNGVAGDLRPDRKGGHTQCENQSGALAQDWVRS